jgi:ribonuclease BN (tRNA processing enzyme)
MRTVGEGDAVDVGSLRIRFAEASHSVPALCVRFEGDGPALAYSGDTGPGGGLPALAEGVGLLLCEAAYQGDRDQHPYPFHLTAAEAGTLAREAGAQRLMLTHIQPSLDAARSVAEAEERFGRPVELAVPGMAVEV